jgi:hypothetical protein
VARVALALALSLALVAACAPRVPAPALRSRDVAVGEVRIRIEWLPDDDRSAERIARAVELAVPRALRWGALPHPVTIRIHPSHAALEAAVHRHGYDWLRAWARHQTIDIQSPRTWTVFGATDRKIEELVTHELTHCAMYQLAGTEVTWMYKEIPRWFSEGLASVAAGQGYRYAGVEVLSRFYQDRLPGSGDGDPTSVRAGRFPVSLPDELMVHPDSFPREHPPLVSLRGDPLADSDPLYQEHSHLVYGAAHHAVELLVARYGEERVRRIVETMGRGPRFPAAFQEAIGISDAEFASDFRRHVVARGGPR